MPGLKKEKKSLGNIKAMMGSNPPPAIQTQDNIDMGEKIYAKTFETIGKAARAKYEADTPPRLHRLFFEELVETLDGQKKGHIVLTPIIEKLGTSRGVSAKILSCLEAYGYLRITRDENTRGRTLIFEILRAM